MLFNFSLFSNRSAQTHSFRGFGLVELMVSISIMTLVTTVILVKNRSFNNALLLRNQAYEIAFSLRQAQLLAVSGTREVGATSNQYGIHFDVSSEPANGRYRLFRDGGIGNPNPGWYSASDDSPIGTLGMLDNRYIIQDIVIADNSGNSLSRDALSVTFIRPNFDALFRTSAGTSVTGPVYLKITPKDTTGYSVLPSRLVEITATGQISVK
jgi:Tfp pilus assembly protein FimT